MPLQPTVVVLDVNETLSDMRPMARRFRDVGAPEHLARLWFATLLRDGFALTAAGTRPTFADLGVDALRTVLAGVDLDRDREAAVEHVMSGFSELGLHPDVAEGLRALRSAGYRLVTLTNGAAQVSEQLLAGAGVRDQVERLISVDDAEAWKPARAAYEHAARVCEVPLAEMLLVAAHPWDVDGAARAGLSTAYVDRTGAPYPASFTAPDLVVTGLGDLAARLG
ncbi:haloacid dehalogenase type II [Pseudokineococcus sp. 1T1Z-3]|uniref:haloacid dehalogenase type II n=1 Tax=Pseudokineococcus sp. 1T1Z-3 TaxID=3132745 RepID=UPI0030B537DB